MTEKKKAGNRKKWVLVSITIMVISLVFTWIAWKSMHPSDTVTIGQLEEYADARLLDDMECINGSYVALIYEEETKESKWYAVDTDAKSQAESSSEESAEIENVDTSLEEIAGKADVQIKNENISPIVIFLMYVIQFGICYGFVWFAWKLYGKFRIGKRKEHYRV